MKRISRIGITFGLLITLAAGCGRGGGDEAAARPAPEGTAYKASSVVYRVPVDGAPVKGDRSALVTLVSFSDYECPFCTKGHAVVEQLQKTYGDKLRVVARQNPLRIHDHAEPAALAAFAAAEQGKFWEMNERLFANSRALDEESLDRLAQEIGLDVARFRAARQSPEARASLDRDRALAASLNVRGTPAYFINGRKVEGARSLEEFKNVIDEEIRKAEDLLAGGVRPTDLYDALMKDAIDPKPTAEQAPRKGAGEAAADDSEGGQPCGGGPPPSKAALLSDEVVDVSEGSAQMRGPSSAPVTIVVFSDFECPFSKKAESTLRALEEQYKGKLRFAFRNHPLPFHEHARLAAKAALAANEQGRFWEYHDALFAHQDKLDRPALERYAAEIGLDMTRFRAALDEGVLDAALDADADEASRLQLRGAPTVFVNGRRILGAQPLELFREAVDKALAAAPRP
jgi:protein-disulfide isomerase